MRFAIAIMAMLIATILSGGPAMALDPARTFEQYKHSRWVVEDGAPAGIFALAQGPDGYLWIGSREGLFRFDGIAFEPIRPRAGADRRVSISSLLSAKDGTLWVGYIEGGVAIYRNGALLDARLPDNSAYVMNLVQTTDGAIWAQLGGRDPPLMKFEYGRWHEVGADWGLRPGDHTINVLASRDGRLWLSTLSSVLVLEKGGKRFRRTNETPVGHAALSEDRHGNIWLSDKAGTRPIAGDAKGRISYPTPPAPRAVRTFFDRDGTLWGVTGDKGTYRVRGAMLTGEKTRALAAAKVDQFRQSDRLTSDNANAIMEDREGNVWIGTSLGLDRFRAANVVVEPLLKKLPMWGMILLGASDGTVYVGTLDVVYRIAPGGKPRPVLSNEGEPEAMCEGPDGAVWMVQSRGIVRFADNRRSNLVRPVGARWIVDCAVDQRNVLWLASSEGLFRREGSNWLRSDLPVQANPAGSIPLLADRHRGLLMYASTESLRRITYPKYSDTVLGKKGALRDFRTLYEGKDGILLGGGFGLALWRGEQVRFLNSSRIPAFSNITGMVETPNGETWTIGNRGIARVRTADLNRGFADPKFLLRPELFDFRDGLLAVNIREGSRAAVRGGDGRLWFATTAGTVWIDPARLARNVMPPPIAISALKSKGVTYRDPNSLALPSGSSVIEIAFTALSLSIPERVRFRYKLEGVDNDWIDPGSRRQAFYSNLDPGTYRFHVMASNNDGVWNRAGKSLEFTIAPTFFQSNWFLLLQLIGIGSLLWLAYSIRVRQVAGRLREALEVRMAERERIARELHDTLLQGFQGLVLRFQAVANRLPKDQALRPMMEEILERAEEVLVEGRDRVRELRVTTGDPAQLLSEVADELVADWPGRFHLTVEGTPRALDPFVCDEVQHIGEEAIRNAFQHSKASTIEAVLSYLPAEFRFQLRDDGIGLPNSVVSTGARDGHYGLVGMRERANRISALLTISSRSARGTEVTLSIPAAAAYAERTTRWRELFKRLAPKWSRIKS